MAVSHDSAPTHRLIAGAKVAGTPVYDTAGERLGAVEDVMIDKESGRIAYAVLSFGGFLGMGEKHHPLPWVALRYDTALGGYVVALDRTRLEGAPALADESDEAWGDPAWGQRIHDYYGLSPYWSMMP